MEQNQIAQVNYTFASLQEGDRKGTRQLGEQHMGYLANAIVYVNNLNCWYLAILIDRWAKATNLDLWIILFMNYSLTNYR